MAMHYLRGLIPGVLLTLAGTAMAAEQTILVTGATGRQGGAVVDALQARGYAVRGMTRKPEGKKAQKLSAQGVEVVQGDFGDPASLSAAMADVHGVFFYSGFSPKRAHRGY